MRPYEFADLLKQWVTAAQHPGIAGVRTCADVGRWEQPCGIRVDLTDGWAFLLQVVRGAPPGGDHDGYTAPPTGQDVYAAARAASDTETGKVRALKGGRPQARVGVLLSVVEAAVAGAGHEEVRTVVVSARPGGVPVLRVTTTDGAVLYGLPVGWFAPGSTVLMHPAHTIPADW